MLPICHRLKINVAQQNQLRWSESKMWIVLRWSCRSWEWKERRIQATTKLGPSIGEVAWRKSKIEIQKSTTPVIITTTQAKWTILLGLICVFETEREHSYEYFTCFNNNKICYETLSHRIALYTMCYYYISFSLFNSQTR